MVIGPLPLLSSSVSAIDSNSELTLFSRLDSAMGWLSSLFSTDNSRDLRRGQAMSSTHEAFSLPTTSPSFSSHPDAFNPDVLNTPDPESATSPSYTYPPQSAVSTSYEYMPASSLSRPNSLLPIYITPSAPYPPLSHTWNRLRAWLTREYPELGDTLNYGMLPQDLAQIEMQFGFALPAAVRESYLVVDGQEAESAAGCSEGLFFGLTLLPLENVLEEWRFWREVDDDPATGANQHLREMMQSMPPGWVRSEYSQRGWIPLVADKAGNYVGVDLNPGESGSIGQVIVFGREFDTKVVLWRGDGPAGWAKWLASFVDDLENGEGYELGATNEASEGSEDGVGYESYFYDGSGRGLGDGGGDAGSGGLRLTGEYKGWNVLEAWADRSVRRWQEAGTISEPQPDRNHGKGPERHGLGALGFAVHSASGGAEVPIPVLADVSEPSVSSAPALGNVTNIVDRPLLPTISVTKPPAPLPVDVPTAHDIVALPSPPDSTHSSFDEDLEAGRNLRQIHHEQDSTLPALKSTKPVAEFENPDAGGSKSTGSMPLPNSPSSDARGLDERLATILSPSAPSMINVTDLLVDSSPDVNATVITPSSPLLDKPPESILSKNELGDGPPDDPIEQISESGDAGLQKNPQSTIRLVGEGGSPGVVDVFAEDDATPGTTPGSDGATGIPVSADSSEKAGKHKKNKSISSGLKKLGQLSSGKRRKDSNSSLKDNAV